MVSTRTAPPYVHPGILLSGSGYFGKNALPTVIANPALNPTGNIYISTYSTASVKVAYSLVVQFRKTRGFAPRPNF